MTDRPADEVLLEELASKATRGPWLVVSTDVPAIGYATLRFPNHQPHPNYDPGEYADLTKDDWAWLAAAHPDAILALLSRLTALRAERDAANARAERLKLELRFIRNVGKDDITHEEARNQMMRAAQRALDGASGEEKA